jgi:hypothetical protein
MASKEEFIKTLEISTFSKPILKEMGIKAIFLVNFDIILGPIAYINKLTSEKIAYLEFLQDLAHLGEFYTGISHAQIDKVTTRTGEEMLVGRATRKVNEIELIDIAVALVETTTEYQKEIIKMLKFAIRTSYGNPDNFCELLDRVLLEYQDIGKKKTADGPRGTFKELAQEKVPNIVKMYKNWDGIIFLDFEGDKINSAFMPDWIEARKINPIDQALKIREMYQKGQIIPRVEQDFTLVTMKGKQVLVVSSHNLRFATIAYLTAEGMGKIPQIAKDLDILNDALSEKKMVYNTEAMKQTLEIIDKRIGNGTKNELMKDVVMIMISAGELLPQKQITDEEYEALEGEMQKKFFKGFSKAYKEFDGTKTVLEITHKVNTTLEKMADFVVYCMTRGIVQVFAKNGRKK